jgi:hypothetical protein
MPLSISLLRLLALIAFLPPFAPSPLRDFLTTTRALSPPMRGTSHLSALSSTPPMGRDPRFTSLQLPTVLPPTIPDDPFRALAVSTGVRLSFGQPLSGPAGASRASPLSRRLAVVSDRIEFSIVLLAGWLFASGCSPPHLSVTQLPSATEVQLPPIGTSTQLLVRAHGRTGSRRSARDGLCGLGSPSHRTPKAAKEWPRSRAYRGAGLWGGGRASSHAGVGPGIRGRCGPRRAGSSDRSRVFDRALQRPRRKTGSAADITSC